GDHDRVPRSCAAHSQTDRLVTIRFHLDPVSVPDPGQHVLDYRFGSLGTRVVRGDDREVRQVGTGLTHQWTFRPVTVAAGADHGYQASGRHFPRRPEDVL